MNLSQRWHAIWKAAGTSESVSLDLLYQDLVSRYSESHRKYHTLQHLENCFERLDECMTLARFPNEMALAFWFHDAFYDTQSKDNELKSAQWASSTVLAAGLPMEAAERIYLLIMATQHNVPPSGSDAELLVDIDLSILGSESSRFDEYEQQIREEYDWVPELLYRQERLKLLNGFLARPHIFYTSLFFDRYERQARLNIERVILRLGA